MTTQATNWSLRKLRESELDTLYIQRIEPDFPSAERPSLPAMHRHMQHDLQTIYIMHNDTDDFAYAVCAEANDIILVTLLAVYKENRGGGYGSALLALLKETYADKRAIILEVENPEDAEDVGEHATRERRIAFYERNGYTLLPDIAHISFDVPLLVMALPLADTLVDIDKSAVDDLKTIYHIILPENRWEKVVTSRRA